MRQLSNELIAQLYTQSSDDPFLILYKLDHSTWDEPIYLVNNPVQIVSNGDTYEPFPIDIKLPVDDGESIRKVSLTADNVSQLLIEELRKVTDQEITVEIKTILASNPDYVEMELTELKIKNISYNAQTISADIYLDDFLNTELSSEKYTPTIYPGMFT